MSREPPAEVTCSLQADLLDALRTAPGPRNTAQLTRASGYGRTKATRQINALLDQRHIMAVPSPVTPDVRRIEGMGRTAIYYAITRSGSMALARWRRRMDMPEPVVAPPARSSLWSRPMLVASAGMYCRNDGNKHVLSRGFSC